MRLTAAGLLIAATAALLSLSPDQRAYGIEGLRERLLTIRSLYLKSWTYDYTKTDAGRTPRALPNELFVEPQYPRYQFSTGIAGLDDSQRFTAVITHVVVADGEKTMLLHKDKKTATFTPTDKLQSELMAEVMLQRGLLERLGMTNLNNFDKAGIDRVNGVMCDLYERIEKSPVESLKFRSRIWLNPQDGMPVKVASYHLDPSGKEQIIYECTDIAINVAPPEGMVSFAVPAGYEKVEANPVSEFNSMATLTGSGGSTTKDGTKVSLQSGVAFNIDDKGILYCWSLRITGKDGPRWFEGQPEFSLEGAEKRPCEEITLRTDDNGEHQERWSLVIPRDRRPLGNSSLNMIHSYGGNTCSMNPKPLEFPPKRLSEIVEECQRRTLPANHAPEKIWTLEELRQKLAGIK